METDIHEMGDPAEWQAEWKWDGIRGTDHQAQS